ncbi:MAG: sodium:solute symporter family protein [Planctomycetota bacterium]
MHWIDVTLLVVYFLAMLGVGAWFLHRNEDEHDYYVGGRSMGAGHVGLSVVATDVGGGFSIGLGGLGFSMGIAGSWMLFTGLIGAWVAAALVIPKVHKLGATHRLLTYPQLFRLKYSRSVAIASAWISAIGYLGFTASQLLAGAKLASATVAPLTLNQALLGMGALAVVYTSMGGMKAVIYTDTVQWAILLLGLTLVGLPVAYHEVGGWKAMQAALPAEMLSLGNLKAVTAVNWAFTIIPIWFVGMTLYQRIYACRDEQTARRAWLLAGVLEWPLMAFLGVLLGMFARVAWLQGAFAEAGHAPGSTLDPELGLPMLLATLLPVGAMGIMLAAYFSAILSTADSCLMAASGNVHTDLLPPAADQKATHRRSQRVTLVLGAAAILLAAQMESVLDLMLKSYAFMVSGLLIPTLAMLFVKRPSSRAALAAMIAGGTVTLALMTWGGRLWLGLDANLFGITAALCVFLLLHTLDRRSAAAVG